ncbi:MAG: T9SS type A sorting domain-containing protein [Bacteroidetes bacterium]|nr:T9SS type A sorting domain-containing protein [Bacteroidota bacterium]
MKTKILILLLLTTIHQPTFSQLYPTFGPEIKVTITGLTFDAMEPFISIDGTTLFFNSLNSGGNTNLYYATKVNDSTFNYIGLVGGCYDSSPNHLDAVASLDSMNNFFWTSLRSIPNLYRGIFLAGMVNNISKVYGTCNITTPGWIIMDAAINYQGNLLYYSNGYFGPTFTECVGVPCEAKLSVAQKINDSTFNKTIYSDGIFSNVNDTNYLVYAPQITEDGLELYYTRLLKGGFNTEICVSIRTTISDTFSFPTVIHSNFSFFPEAATPTTDKQKIYYHQKDGTQIFHIYLRYRTGTTGMNEHLNTENIKVYPNPTNSVFNLVLSQPLDHFTVIIYSLLGKELSKSSNNSSIDISNFTNGIYFLTIKQNDRNWTTKIVKE